MLSLAVYTRALQAELLAGCVRLYTLKVRRAHNTRVALNFYLGPLLPRFGRAVGARAATSVGGRTRALHTRSGSTPYRGAHGGSR